MSLQADFVSEFLLLFFSVWSFPIAFLCVLEAVKKDKLIRNLSNVHAVSTFVQEAPTFERSKFICVKFAPKFKELTQTRRGH